MLAKFFFILIFTAKMVQLEQLEERVRRYLTNICTDVHEVYMPVGVVPCYGDELCEMDVSRKKMFYSGKSGCYCRPGYARNSCDGKCIPTEQCPTRKCKGPNEIYINIAQQPKVCDPYCNRLDEKCTCDKKKLNKNKPVPNCFCIEGTARDDNDTCVPIVNCPLTNRRCNGTNEVYLNSHEAPDEDAVCDQRGVIEEEMQDYDEYEQDNKPKAGCFCRQGFFRNINKQCVERRYCKVKCPDKNAIFLPRGTAPRCEVHSSRSCPSKWKYCLPLLDVPEGCFCKKDFLKNDRNICESE